MQKVKQITLLFTDLILIFFFLVFIGFGDAFRLFPLIILIINILLLEKFKHHLLELKQWFKYYFLIISTLLYFYFLNIYEHHASSIISFLFYLVFVIVYTLICNLKTNLIITTILYLSFSLCFMGYLDRHVSFIIYSLFIWMVILSGTNGLTIKESFNKLKKRLE